MTLVLALCLSSATAAPTVLAQSAGDDQYSDPFETSGGSQTSTSTAAPAPSPAPATPAAPAVPQTPAQQPAAPTSPSVSELPRTGVDLRPIAVGGLLLIAAGLMLVRWSRAAGL
jgi:hypothetical protein